MTGRIVILLRNVGLASPSYCVVCFAVTTVLYLVVVSAGLSAGAFWFQAAVGELGR